MTALQNQVVPAGSNTSNSLGIDQDLFNQVLGHYKTDVNVPWAWNPNQQNYDQYSGAVGQSVSSFNAQFQNLVGRAPTADETKRFVTGFVIPNTDNIAQKSSNYNQNPSSQIQQFLGENFQGAAKDYASQQLTAQQGQANDLAELFRSQGNTAINSTEQSLLDYQQKLFERLRPNLITSLKAQGLLDTGGFNEAMAGQQGDLANEGARQVADLRLQNDNAANAIAYGGASAPYMFNQNQIMQQPDRLFAAGQQGLANTTNSANAFQQYQYQLGLLAQQNKYAQENKPSFLNTLGQSAATSLGSNLNGPSWLKAASGSGAAAAGM